MKLTIEAAYDYLDNLVGTAETNIQEAIKVANEYGLSFRFQPDGVGTYQGKLTYERALEIIEKEEYDLLDEEDQWRVNRVLQNKIDSFDSYDRWMSSWC